MAIADVASQGLKSAGELPKPIGTLLAVPSLPSPEALERHHTGEPCPENWVRVDFIRTRCGRGLQHNARRASSA